MSIVCPSGGPVSTHIFDSEKEHRMKPTFVLIHGSWQGGWSWRQVQDRLEAAGYRTLAPTLPGYSPGDNKSRVTHADYVDAVVSILDGEAGDPVVLVGHSFGGSVITRVADLRPDRCRALVYYAAFVPRDGESVADILPAEFVGLLEQLAAASPDRSVTLPYEVFWHAFVNTADHDTAAAIYQRFTAEPFGPIFEPIPLPHVDQLDIPTAYITCRQDLTMPAGLFHPGQSSRLKDPRLIEIDGDHETLLTAPVRLAEALLQAVGDAPAVQALDSRLAS
jgi:pimeloyl-ACP methyl ester carboxylesterase